MGVHPHLPIQDIDIILGNDLAGATRVWKDGPPCCLVSPLQESGEPDDNAKQYPKVSSSFAMTHSRSKAESQQSKLCQPSQKLVALKTVLIERSG